MKNILFCFLFFAFTAQGQVAEPTQFTTDTGQIVGGAGFIKFSLGDPNRIEKIKSIDERFTAAFAWDTLQNVLWQYQRRLPLGSRWRKTQFVAYSNGTPTVASRDTALKMIVDTANRQLYICNQNGCNNITPSVPAPITVGSGLNMFGNEIKLGGTLTESATFFITTTGKLKLKGLDSGATYDSLLVVDWTGVVRKLNVADVTANYYKSQHKTQNISYSSNFISNPIDFSLLPPSQFSVNVQSDAAIVQFIDTNTSFYGGGDIVLVLPERSLYNGTIRFMPAPKTAMYLNTPSVNMFDKLTFTSVAGTSIINPSVFTNVPYNTVFECQYLTDAKKWYVTKLN